MARKKKDTFIKLFRKSLKNELFLEKPFDRWHAFEYFLLHARATPGTVVIKGKEIQLEVGQLIRSESSLADTFGWSRGKVRRFIHILENLKMCQANSTAHGTIITVENYTFYQGTQTAGGTTDSTTDGTTDGTQKKNDIKNDKRMTLSLGECENVFLTSDELEKLKEKFPATWERRIEELSLFMKSTGRTYESHYAQVCRWELKNDSRGTVPSTPTPPVFKKFEPREGRQACPMPDELREKIKGALK